MRKNLGNDPLPEIIFSSSDPTVSKGISDLLREGKLKKLIPRVYTSNLTDSPEEITKRNCWQMIAHLFPNSLISHRSALEFKPSPAANIYLTGDQRRVYRWPGLNLRMTTGPSPLKDDQVFYNNLFVSSLERACLENLSPSRMVEGERRTIDQEIIEERLLMILNTRGEKGLNEVRDRAREISEELGWKKEFKKLNKIISSILSTHPSDILKSPLATARALGEPYDAHRLELFQILIAALKNHEFPDRPQKTEGQEAYSMIAFYESYFSNYIEGTTFLVEEAKDIIYGGKVLPNRTGDSHDILGTYQICGDRFEMKKTAKDEEQFLELLTARHEVIMQGRPDKNPGAFKEKPNRAGKSFFVEPSLVKGTLKRGFNLMSVLSNPISKAFFMMFLISEVHPFADGNGRIARIMMNAELVKAGISKLLIPTVYRDDYLLNLKKLTNKQQPLGFIKMMDRAHAFSHWLEPGDWDGLQAQLQNSNAFRESDEAVLRVP